MPLPLTYGLVYSCLRSAAGRASLAPVRSSMVVPLSLCGTASCSANAWAGDIPSPLWPPGGSLPSGSFACLSRLYDWTLNGHRTASTTALIDLSKTALMSDAFGSHRPLDPELLFDALYAEVVDYVVIGDFAINAHGATQSVEAIELTIDRTIENCARFIEVLVNLDARRVVSFRDGRPVDRHAPMRILDGEFRFDTVAGAIDLRSPPRLRLPRLP